ncbi:MAG: hypothetical protein R3F46_03800 [bacterium]
MTAISCLLLLACQRQPAPAAAPLAIVALNDPANPYRGQYADWDAWIIANLDPHSSQMPGATVRQGEAALFVNIDEHGCLIPYELHARRERTGMQRGIVSAGYGSTRLLAQGPISDELQARLSAMLAGISAEGYPEIPDWLMQEPPEAAMFMPNGDVLCRLPAAESKYPDPELEGRDGVMIWQRHAADGELLGWTSGHWLELYVGSAGMPEGQLSSIPGAMLEVRALSGSGFRLLDYDGTELDPLNPPQRNLKFGNEMSRSALEFTYEGQRAGGME